MKYALLIYTDESAAAEPGSAEAKAEFEGYMAFTESINAEGIILGGEALNSTDSATTVRIRNDETTITDGPFAETKEQLAGFYLVECRDLDHAIEVASRIPGARYGSIEVRPLWEFDPTDAPT